MPSADAAPRSVRAFGPIRLLDAPLGRQLLGLALGFVGVQLVRWAVESGSLTPAVVFAAIGTFVASNGLYLAGVRPR